MRKLLVFGLCLINPALAFAGQDAITVFSIVKLGAERTSYRAVVGKGNGGPNYGYLLAFTPSSNRLNLYLHNDRGISPHATWSETNLTELKPARWQMVAATWDNQSNRLKYYVNGLLDGDYPTPAHAQIGTNQSPVEIGTMIDGNYPIGGSIYTVKVFSRALSSREIQLKCLSYKIRLPSLSCF